MGNNTVDPRLYCNTARDFLDAVHKLVLEGQENEEQITQTSPSLVCLAYAYELIFKAFLFIENNEFKKVHNLTDLFEELPDKWSSLQENFTQEYTLNRVPTGSYAEVALQIDPSICSPSGNFIQNLEILNAWTDKPYYARYPQEILGISLDISFMHFIAQQYWEHLRNECFK